MNRDDHEREIFEKALSLPDVEPYDLSQPFDAQKLMDGLIEERRIVRAADDPELARMAEIAERAWSDFLERANDEGARSRLKTCAGGPRSDVVPGVARGPPEAGRGAGRVYSHPRACAGIRKV